MISPAHRLPAASTFFGERDPRMSLFCETNYSFILFTIIVLYATDRCARGKKVFLESILVLFSGPCIKSTGTDPSFSLIYFCRCHPYHPYHILAWFWTRGGGGSCHCHDGWAHMVGRYRRYLLSLFSCLCYMKNTFKKLYWIQYVQVVGSDGYKVTFLTCDKRYFAPPAMEKGLA